MYDELKILQIGLLALSFFFSLRTSYFLKQPPSLINRARYSWFMVGFALILVLLSLGLMYLLPSAAPNTCDPSDDRWIVALLSGFFGLSGLLILAFARYATIEWNSTAIAYRSALGKKCTAYFDDITTIGDYPYLEMGYVKFSNAPTLYFSTDNLMMENIEKFQCDVIHHYKETQPYQFYEPAIRELTEESDECGCLICLTIYPVSAIAKWRQISADWEDPDDLAICPTCDSKETVVCDMGAIKITASGLRMLNMELEAELSAQETCARQAERETIFKKLNPEDLPPGFSI